MSSSQLHLSRPYYTSEQIKYAQSKTIGDRRTYNQKKTLVIKFLLEVAQHLKFPTRTLEATMYMYQRFYLFNKFEDKDAYDVAMTCLFFSAKREETIKRLGDVITVCLTVRHYPGSLTPELIENVKKKVFSIELKLMEVTCFDFRINTHIDECVVKIAKTLGLSYQVSHLAWLISFDAIKLETLLKVPPHSVALACLFIAAQYLKENLPPIKAADFATNEESIDEALFDILNFYINVFDLCHLTMFKSNITVQTFIDIKLAMGPETGLQKLAYNVADDKSFGERDYTLKERRYVLSNKRLHSELR